MHYLRLVEEANSKDVQLVVGESKEKVDRVLSYLVKEGYILKKRRNYLVLKKIDWSDSYTKDEVPINYRMPYFDDIGYFKVCDLILIGGQQKVGKSHIALNIIQRLVKQGIKPYYINLEPGNRFVSISRSLGLKEGDFFYTTFFHPEQLELEDNAITIIDWLLPKDYAETDKLFQHFCEQLYKHKGNLIVFMQLRESGDFYAKDMTAMFPALVCKYLYDKDADGNDIPTSGYFKVDYIREPTTSLKKYKIPCKYNWSTRILSRLDELDSNIEEKSEILMLGG